MKFNNKPNKHKMIYHKLVNIHYYKILILLIMIYFNICLIYMNMIKLNMFINILNLLNNIHL